MAITTVLFDLDDTLTDAGYFGASVLVAAAEEHRHALSLEVVRQHPGAAYVPLLQELLDVDASEAATIYATYVRRYREMMPAGLQPHAGAPELLAALVDQGMRLGLVTNKLEALASEILAQFGWDALFDTVIGQDSCDYRKPHPGIALHALDVLESSPGATAFVGDTVSDMRCASEAGIGMVIGLATTTPAGALASAGATSSAATLAEVGEMLAAGAVTR